MAIGLQTWRVLSQSWNNSKLSSLPKLHLDWSSSETLRPPPLIYCITNTVQLASFVAISTFVCIDHYYSTWRRMVEGLLCSLAAGPIKGLCASMWFGGGRSCCMLWYLTQSVDWKFNTCHTSLGQSNFALRFMQSLSASNPRFTSVWD